MAYGSSHKKSYSHKSHKNGLPKATGGAAGVKTPYKGAVGQRKAYRITGKI